MTQREFNHLLRSLKGLSPDQLDRLRLELEAELNHDQAMASKESVFDLLNRAGLIGCIKGVARTPTDLSTNPMHMEGFGRD